MITQYFNDLMTALRAVSAEEVEKAIGILQRAKYQNAVAYVFGNGGSAATAGHFANDLTKESGMRAVALNDLTPTATAFGNDNGWENMYADMLKRFLLPQDVVVGISCSGFSANVVKGIEMAKTIALPAVKTIVLTGNTWESPLTQLKPDVVVYVPFADIRVQEDCHLAICHAILGGLR